MVLTGLLAGAVLGAWLNEVSLRASTATTSGSWPSCGPCPTRRPTWRSAFVGCSRPGTAGIRELSVAEHRFSSWQ
jgi:hypothetical protein